MVKKTGNSPPILFSNWAGNTYLGQSEYLFNKYFICSFDGGLKESLSIFTALTTHDHPVIKCPNKSPKIIPTGFNAPNEKAHFPNGMEPPLIILFIDNDLKYPFLTHHSLKQLNRTKQNAESGQTHNQLLISGAFSISVNQSEKITIKEPKTNNIINDNRIIKMENSAANFFEVTINNEFSYFKVATMVIIDVIDVRVANIPKSAGEYNRDRIGYETIGINCAKTMPIVKIAVSL